jgi:2-polyprenyl-3-methyl-5-hydroxy-6-metoxy-1,4-benzoquinol methylase
MYANNDYSRKGDEYFGEDRLEMVSYIPRNTKRLLDVGCSSGNFGKTLKIQDPEISVWGIEPFEKAANIAAQKLDKVICTSFRPNIPELENQQFDCITFNDVLEHIVNPDEALSLCHPLLSDNGVLIASIPNVLFFPVMYNLLKKEDWQYEESGVLDKTHVKFYTKKSIARLFKTCGYEIIKLEGINIKIHDKFRLYKLLNFLFFNKLKDWKYMQFVVVAKKQPKK